MQRKVGKIAGELAQALAAWPGVEAVMLGEAAEARLLDPYFTISVDVYYAGELPPAAERRRAFGNPTAFDSMAPLGEDRFLREDLPVKIRYLETSSYALMLQRIEDRQWVFHDAGTYPFYRMMNGQLLNERSSWVEQVRTRLVALPEHFWQVVMDSTRLAVAYHLNDLRAAVFRADRLFTAFSLSQFLGSLCSFLFAANRTFEPSARLLGEKVRALPRLPDGFAGRFESLLRDDPELPPERKCEIAELLAKSILPMA
jgi:hypothetical protein